MIQHVKALDELDLVLQVEGSDAVFIGPDVLSASLGLTAQSKAEEFSKVLKTIGERCASSREACGLHVVTPETLILRQRLSEEYLFIAYLIGAAFLRKWPLILRAHQVWSLRKALL